MMLIRLPERMLTNPRERASRTRARASRRRELRRFRPGVMRRQVRAILIAVPLVELGVVRIRVAGADLAEGVRRVGADAARHRCSCRSG